MDGSFFAFALVGALAGYIIGDFQRELRFRRQVRDNLALTVSRTDNNGNGNSNGNTVPGSVAFGNGNGDSEYRQSLRREARSRAVRGDYNGDRPGNSAAGGSTRRAATASLIGAARDC